MSTSKQFNRMVGTRVRFARDELGITQEELASHLGFKDRQTISSIESGARNLLAEELLRLMELFNKPRSFFTDPFTLLPGELDVTWRARASADVLAPMEPRLANIIVAFRGFCSLLGEPHVQLCHTLKVKRRDSLEYATSLGEGLSATWGLGEIPARNLWDVIEDKLNIILFSLDLPPDVSGASFRLNEVSSIIINRNEVYYRRNYDLAHELFHLLTWDSLRHRKLCSQQDDQAWKEERLAESFAAGLLMPRSTLQSWWQSGQRTSVIEWINNSARELQVSGEALYWRLVNLKWIEKGVVTDLKQLRRHGGTRVEERPLKPYSTKFVARLHDVLDRGFVSVRKAAALLDCSIEDMAELFREYNMPIPFDL